jgi:hypothetical protein
MSILGTLTPLHYDLKKNSNRQVKLKEIKR